MVATLFLLFLGLMAATVVALSAHYLGAKTAANLFVGLCVWFLYVGLLGYFGVIRNPATKPPGIILVFIPVLVFLFVFIWRSASSPATLALPLWIILGTQSFRVGVELFLHQLWLAGLIPKMLTFSGANVDIYIGASAPLIAWLSTRGRWGLQLAFLWNIAGLCTLANAVGRAVLTSPGPFNLLHAEVPNRMFGIFPFMFVPGFFVPLAVVLHVIALRIIHNRLQARNAHTSPQE